MKFLSKTTIILLIFILFWLSICLSIVNLGWEPTWNFLQIPTISPIFADMRTVQGSILSLQQGYNPQIENPGDPWGRAMNYPYVWVIIAKFFHLNNESAFILLVGFYVSTFLICGILLLRDFPSVYILLAMFSGTTLLAIERGNNDLLVYVLLFLGIFVSNTYQRDYVKLFSFLLAIVLKIYPIFVIAGFIKKPKLFFFSIIASLIYLVSIYSELNIIQNGNTATGNISYGLKNLLSLHPSLKFYCLVFFSSLLLLIALIKNIKLQNINEKSPKSVDFFVTGGIIFISTYIINPNWDYRLIFLLPCIPLITTIQNKLVRLSTLISILIVMNSIGLRNIFPIYLSVCLKHYVFLVILACTIIVFKSFLSSISISNEYFLSFLRKNAINN